jgi:hypothetical protein
MDYDVILELSLINICLGVPNYFDKTCRNILKKVLLGNLKIEGMLKHPLQLTRLTNIFR